MNNNNNLEIKRVPFLGTELMAARDADGQIWVGVSYICRGIGLSDDQKRHQIRTVQSDEVLKEGCVKFGTGVFDPNNPTIALKLDFVPLWLAKISITPAMKVGHSELTETLKQYQLHAKDVLAAAFLPSLYSREESTKLERPALSSVNDAMKITIDVMKAAGIAPEYIALTVKDTYKPYGINIPDSCFPEKEKLFECEAIAQELGILSEKGNPHRQAVSAIIGLIGILEGESKIVPFMQGGYSNTTVKYTRTVLEHVKDWLEEHDWPKTVRSSEGKNYKVQYRDV